MNVIDFFLVTYSRCALRFSSLLETQTVSFKGAGRLSLFALNAALLLFIVSLKFAFLMQTYIFIQLFTINTIINIYLSFSFSVIAAEGSEPPERLSNNMTQLDTGSLEKRED